MFQQVVVIGRVGQDPELRAMPSGQSVANFSIAVSEKWKDKNDEVQEHTEWFRCNAFGKTAEVAGEYLKKGFSVSVAGRLRTRKWEDKNGDERTSVELLVDKLTLLDNRAHKEGGGGKDRDDDRPARGGKDSSRGSDRGGSRSAGSGPWLQPGFRLLRARGKH